MLNKDLIILLLTLSLFSCATDPLDIDTSSIEVEIYVRRMEQELFQPESNNIIETHDSILEFLLKLLLVTCSVYVRI